MGKQKDTTQEPRQPNALDFVCEVLGLLCLIVIFVAVWIATPVDPYNNYRPSHFKPPIERAWK